MVMLLLLPVTAAGDDDDDDDETEDEDNVIVVVDVADASLLIDTLKSNATCWMKKEKHTAIALEWEMVAKTKKKYENKVAISFDEGGKLKKISCKC